MQWELLYKGPRGVVRTFIETTGDEPDEARARRVAEYFIDSLANPHIRLVDIKPSTVMTEARMQRELAGEYGEPAEAPASADAPSARSAAARRPARPAPRNTTKNHRRGANAADSRRTGRETRGEANDLDAMAGHGRIGD